MKLSRSVVLLAALALAASGCGRHVARTRQIPPSAAPICRLQSTWTNGELRTLRGGHTFADVWGADADATIDRADGVLRVHVLLTTGGWHLEGSIDPQQDDALRVRTMTPLLEGLTLTPGASTRLFDARPVDRHGELLIGLSRIAMRSEDGVHFPMPPQRWVRCEDVGFSFAYRDEGTEPAERTALGLPAQPREGRLPAGQIVRLASTPGGPPFVELGPSETTRYLYVLDANDAFSRVLLHEWTGTMLVGWLPTSALSAFDAGDGGGMLGLLGGSQGPELLTVCTSPVSLELFAAHAGELFPIGRLDAATRFVRGDVRADGAFTVRPHPDDSLRTSGENIVWMARSDAPLTCTSERHDPAAAFAALRGAPTTTLDLRVTATAVTGVPGTAIGGVCDVRIEHYPGDALPCRATVRCGETVLFGVSPTNGFFECALANGAAPSVSGRDPETSAGSGDAAFTIDSASGTVLVEDDAAGPNGAFHLEAHIESIAEVVPPS